MDQRIFLKAMEQDLNILLRAAVAVILGGILGWERENSGKSAGIRTHMLICLAAALFVALAELFIPHFRKGDDEIPEMRYDPIRILEAVVTGVSFLGAGMIFVSRGSERIKGLTTAAAILVTAAVGIMVGLQRYLLGAGVTLLAILVLHSSTWLKEIIQKRGRHRTDDPSE